MIGSLFLGDAPRSCRKNEGSIFPNQRSSFQEMIRWAYECIWKSSFSPLFHKGQFVSKLFCKPPGASTSHWASPPPPPALCLNPSLITKRHLAGWAPFHKTSKPCTHDSCQKVFLLLFFVFVLFFPQISEPKSL